jgi:proteasome lid subunit RPN8/RPN11
MFFRNKSNSSNQRMVGTASSVAGNPTEKDSLLATDIIAVNELKGGPKPVSRKFPGPAQADAALRVAIDRRAQADIVAHAKESLEAEVCGVLVGEICEDEEGVFVHVEAVIRGTAATEASTHVTFTQATWSAIHASLEKHYPKLRIVGWYHTHPGFGVEFSEMDLFIQKNFFSGPTQIALVTDPLSGAVAICMNTSSGPRYLPRYWVDGREQAARYPVFSSPGKNADGGAGDSDGALQRLETRVSQLAQLIDQQQTSYYRFLMTCGFVFCLAVIAVAAYSIRSAYVSRLEPPKPLSTVPIPVQIGEKTMFIQIGVTGWEIPAEVNAILIEALKLEREAAEAAKSNAATSNATSKAR